MLSNAELKIIYRYAYLPEHLPDYVEAVSGASAHLIDNFLCFYRRNHLIFIGYPLGNADADIRRAYTAACQKFKPSTTAIIAEKIWIASQSDKKQPPDRYYQLKLPLEMVDASVAYMVRRAEKELAVRIGNFGKDHQKLIKLFLTDHDLTKEQKHLFKRIPHYLKRSSSAHLFEARKENILAAFSIVDTGSADYAFYLFNFRSGRINVPGASDLLFHEMVRLAQSEHKKAINLGLGVNAGIRRFKEKWGGVPFLAYHSAVVRRETLELGDIARKL
jgi:hypothetical protein